MQVTWGPGAVLFLWFTVEVQEKQQIGADMKVGGLNQRYPIF